MDMPKLLIADSNDEFRQTLFETLCSTCAVQTCQDGLQALDMIRSFCPDILILDLMLPKLDGLTLLCKARQENLMPTVLATTSIESPYIIDSMERLKVPYLMRRPCSVDAIASRVADFASELDQSPIMPRDSSAATASILLHLEFSTKLDGFTFLQAAIPMYMADPAQPITKEMYTAIGAMYNKDSRQVERSIRSAIETAWKIRNDTVWRRYFPVAPDGTVPRPSNRAFISRIAALLSQQVRCSNF